MKNSVKVLLSMFAVFVFLMLLAGSSESDTSSSTDTNQGTEKKSAFSIGDDVTVGDLAYRVESSKEASSIQSGNEFIDDLTTTGKFVIIDVTVQNNDKESRYVDGAMFKLLDKDGAEYSSTSEADMLINDGTGFFLEKINPKMSRRGKVAFEVPADATNLKLQVSSGLGWSGGDYEEISLGN